jgi:hypothetical protein
MRSMEFVANVHIHSPAAGYTNIYTTAVAVDETEARRAIIHQAMARGCRVVRFIHLTVGGETNQSNRR